MSFITPKSASGSPYLLDFGKGYSEFEYKYGMSAEDAYNKLFEKATNNMDMNLGGGLSQNADVALAEKVTGAQDALKNFVEGHNTSQYEMLSNTDAMKRQVDLAEQRGEYEGARRSPAAALGGYTMDADPIKMGQGPLNTKTMNRPASGTTGKGRGK